MERDKMPATKTSFSRDEERLSFPDYSSPFQDTQEALKNTHQYVLPNCYGKGKRLCEFEVPNTPKSCLQHRQGRGRGSDSAAIILKGAYGRGRATGSTQASNGLEDNVELVQPTEKDEQKHAKEIDKSFKDLENHFSKTDSCQPSLPPPPSSWSLFPPDVCQISGLPVEFEQEVLDDVVSFYSSIVDKEQRRHNGELFIRYKLSSPDACELLAASINEADLFGTGTQVICKHLPS